MYCPKCQSQNEETAQFCRNCGSNLRYSQEVSNNNDTSSLLLLVFILITLILNIANFAIEKLVDNWYEGATRYVHGSLWLLGNISYILPALAIKNKTLKIIGIILVSMLIIYWGYSNIEFMVR
jgi:hypothetical protein